MQKKLSHFCDPFFAFSVFQFEVILCLTYAAIHLTVNILVVIGCETKNRSYLIPWLVWIVFSIAMSITMASFLISNAIHLVSVPDDQDSLGPTGLITISILLLIKTGIKLFLICFILSFTFLLVLNTCKRHFQVVFQESLAQW